MVSKKDREAYDRGQKERKYIRDHPISYLISPSEHEGDTESEKAAFKKGLRDERLDSDKGGSGGCFLTTACVAYAGLPDTCRELEMARRLRDEYVNSLPHGRGFIAEYYETAPAIVGAINSRPDQDVVLAGLLEFTREVAGQVEQGRLAEAFSMSQQKFYSLKRQYLEASGI